MNDRSIAKLSVVLALMPGCASQQARDVQSGLQGERLTLGTVQREIHKGMAGGAVR